MVRLGLMVLMVVMAHKGVQGVVMGEIVLSVVETPEEMVVLAAREVAVLRGERGEPHKQEIRIQGR